MKPAFSASSACAACSSPSDASATPRALLRGAVGHRLHLARAVADAARAGGGGGDRAADFLGDGALFLDRAGDRRGGLAHAVDGMGDFRHGGGDLPDHALHGADLGADVVGGAGGLRRQALSPRRRPRRSRGRPRRRAPPRWWRSAPAGWSVRRSTGSGSPPRRSAPAAALSTSTMAVARRTVSTAPLVTSAACWVWRVISPIEAVISSAAEATVCISAEDARCRRPPVRPGGWRFRRWFAAPPASWRKGAGARVHLAGEMRHHRAELVGQVVEPMAVFLLQLAHVGADHLLQVEQHGAVDGADRPPRCGRGPPRRRSGCGTPSSTSACISSSTTQIGADVVARLQADARMRQRHALHGLHILVVVIGREQPAPVLGLPRPRMRAPLRAGEHALQVGPAIPYGRTTRPACGRRGSRSAAASCRSVARVASSRRT